VPLPEFKVGQNGRWGKYMHLALCV